MSKNLYMNFALVDSPIVVVCYTCSAVMTSMRDDEMDDPSWDPFSSPGYQRRDDILMCCNPVAIELGSISPSPIYHLPSYDMMYDNRRTLL